MVNITHKSNSLRKAIATAVVKVSKEETIRAIEQGLVPKGDVFSFAKVAALKISYSLHKQLLNKSKLSG